MLTGLNRILWIVALTGWPCYARVFTCDEAYRQMLVGRSALASKLNSLPAEQRDFAFRVLQPLLGKRLFESADGVTRDFEILPNGFTVRGFGGSSDINFRWVDHTEEPFFRWENNGTLSIFVPHGYDFKLLKDDGQAFFYRALRGHSLNPFVKSERGRAERNSLKDGDIIHKEVQNEAIRAGTEALARGDDSFLFVGPTGVGKTLVIEGMLSHLVNDTREAIAKAGTQHADVPKLNFVFADKIALVDQLHKDISNMALAKDAVVIRWGGADESPTGPKTMEELAAFAKNSSKPVIVVTVDKTLTGRTGVMNDIDENTDANKITFDPAKLQLLKDNVRSFTIDEAHHAGAPRNIALLDQVRGQSRLHDGTVHQQTRDPNRPLQIVGVTATPLRQDMKFIEHVFDDNAFWGYLDSADSYLANRGKSDRSVGEIVKQLETAIERGEAHPVKTQFINPDKFQTTEEDPLFVQRKPGERGSPFELNPKQYEAFYHTVAPILGRHDHLFFSCSTVEEAKELMKHFSEHQPPPVGPNGQPHKMAYIHAKMPNKAEILEAFKKGEITVLFNVGIMDEGIDIPSLTAYIDTNQSTHPRDLIQRIGRILRLNEGKIRKSEVISFQKIGDVESAQALELINGISLRNWGEDPAPKPPPDPPPGPTPPNVREPVKPEDMAPNVFWTPDEVQARKNSFFKRRISEKLQSSFDDISKYVRENLTDPDYSIDPFQLMNKKERRVLDELYRLATSNGREAENFLYLVSQAPPSIRHHLEKYLRDVKRRSELMKDPVRLATHVRNQRPPPAEPTAEATALSNAVNARKTDPVFLAEVTRSPSPPSPHLDIESAMQRRLKDLGTTLKDVVAFEKHYGRVPDANAAGYEGRLGGALEKYMDIDQTTDAIFNQHFGLLDQDSNSAMHALAGRDAQETERKKRDRPDATQAPKEEPLYESVYADDFPLRENRVVTSLENKLKTQVASDTAGKNAALNPQRAALRKIERLKQLDQEIVRAREEKNREKTNQLSQERDTLYEDLAKIPVLAKALNIAERPTLTLTISGFEGAVEKLQEFYTDTGKRFGFTTTVSGEGTEKVKVTFTSKTGANIVPSQIFPFEGGEHRVFRKDGGRVHTQTVKVHLENGSTALPTAAGGTVRSYDFRGTAPIIVDNPTNKNERQAISANGDRARDFQRAITRRLLLVP